MSPHSQPYSARRAFALARACCADCAAEANSSLLDPRVSQKRAKSSSPATSTRATPRLRPPEDTAASMCGKVAWKRRSTALGGRCPDAASILTMWSAVSIMARVGESWGHASCLYCVRARCMSSRALSTSPAAKCALAATKDARAMSEGPQNVFARRCTSARAKHTALRAAAASPRAKLASARRTCAVSAAVRALGPALGSGMIACSTPGAASAEPTHVAAVRWSAKRASPTAEPSAAATLVPSRAALVAAAPSQARKCASTRPWWASMRSSAVTRPPPALDTTSHWRLRVVSSSEHMPSAP
mmetsp:Transcript_19335/g.61317  ORF Transcript_19335/g.61317 Transcript_19335/m.61317 type:complete len:302 (+) Transcript_19335:264-1169(+)